MIDDLIIEQVVVPAATKELGAYIIVGTIFAIMFVSYHLTNRVEDRLLWAAACKLDGYDPDDLYIKLRPGNKHVRELDRIILEGAKLGYRIKIR
jgi:hypothetical protein